MTYSVYFITHPNVNINPDIPVPEWSLSATGVRRMHAMLKQPWVAGIQSVYCSCEQKAIDGAAILAEHLQTPVHQHQDLGENDRSSTGFLPPHEFELMADRFFANPTESITGWETASDAQSRVVSCVNDITHQPDALFPMAMVSHGAVGTLLLCSLNHWTIDRKHDQPGNSGGNFFCFDARTGEVSHSWQPID